MSLYRLWNRARRPLTSKWEDDNDRPYIAAGKGRGPQDAVWRQAASSEAAVAKGQHAATVLWDMESFFEMLERDRLWHRARHLGFPMTVARVAFNVYEAPRMLAMAGALSAAVRSERGVPAGCGIAMAFTKVYVIPPLDRAVLELEDVGSRPRAIVDLYVDDLAATATGRHAEVVDAITRARDVLLHMIEVELRCEIVQAKSAVVASSNLLMDTLVNRLGAAAGPPRVRGARRKIAATNLGVDYAPGRKRGTHATSGKRRARMNKLRKRTGRLDRARATLGKRAPQIFVTGLLSEAVYGAAVNGVSDAEAQHLRRMAARAFSPRARGRSLSVLSLLINVPTWKAEVAVLMHYARLVWEAALLGARLPARGELTLTQLSDIWHSADRASVFDKASGARRWAEAKGPIASMILEIDRVGWTMEGPFTLVDADGERVHLTQVTPALLGKMMHRAVIRQLETQVGSKLADADPKFAGRRVAVDHVVAQLRGDKTMSTLDKAAYKSVVCGAIMTYSRAVSLGYLVQDLCPLCRARGDTIRHRIWRCPHPEAVAARRRAAPEWLIMEEARRNNDDLLWTTAFLPHLADVWPRASNAADVDVVYGDEGADVQPDDPRARVTGKVCIDGSCTSHVFVDLRRAGAAAVQVNPDGKRASRLRMAVPRPLPQTPQAAEYVSYSVTYQMSKAQARMDILSDCENVVRDVTRGGRTVLGYRKAYAGILKPPISDPSWMKRADIRKVKAHQTISGMADGPDKVDAQGNEWADEDAKFAVTLHPQPSPALFAELDADLRRAKFIVRTIAAVTQVFPAMPKGKMPRSPAARDGAAFTGAGGHAWNFAGGMWRCKHCLRITLKPELTADLVHQKCAGCKPSLEIDAVRGHGHVVACTTGQVPIVFCVRCGSYSARRARGLRAQCRGRPSAPGAQALTRIRAGMQPWLDVPSDGSAPRRARLGGHHLAWEEQTGAFVDAGPSVSRGPGRRRLRATRAPADDHGEDFADEPPPIHRIRTAVNTNAGCDMELSTGDEPGGTMQLSDADAAMLDLVDQWPPEEMPALAPHDDALEEDPFAHGGDLDDADGPPRGPGCDDGLDDKRRPPVLSHGSLAVERQASAQRDDRSDPPHVKRLRSALAISAAGIDRVAEDDSVGQGEPPLLGLHAAELPPEHRGLDRDEVPHRPCESIHAADLRHLAPGGGDNARECDDLPRRRRGGDSQPISGDRSSEDYAPTPCVRSHFSSKADAREQCDSLASIRSSGPPPLPFDAASTSSSRS